MSTVPPGPVFRAPGMALPISQAPGRLLRLGAMGGTLVALLSAGVVLYGFFRPWLTIEDSVGSAGFRQDVDSWLFIASGGLATRSWGAGALFALPVLGGLIVLVSVIGLFVLNGARSHRAHARLSMFLLVLTGLLAGLLVLAVSDYQAIMHEIRVGIVQAQNEDSTSFTLLQLDLPLTGNTPDQQLLITDMEIKLQTQPENLIKWGAGFTLTLVGFAGCLLASLGLLALSMLGPRLGPRVT